MVPLLVVTLLVPLAAGGMVDPNMMQMMQLMQMMQQQKGWGYEMPQQPQPSQAPQQQWWGMQSAEDMEAYLKWCEENKIRQQEQTKQQELLAMWEKKEAERAEMMEKERIKHEAEERQESMMAQWKMWQQKLENMHEFEGLGYEIMEMKHKYMYLVTMEFLRFCKCSDFTETLARYFQHDGLSYNGDEWDLDDLEGIDSNDPVAVAQALANRPAEEQMKAFFGGLAGAMCEGGRQYVQQVMAWEKQYNFLDRLM
jgi:hypothetical protein